MKRNLLGIGTLLTVLLFFTSIATAQSIAYFDPQHNSANTSESKYTYLYFEVEAGENLSAAQIQIVYDRAHINITEGKKPCGPFASGPNQYCWGTHASNLEFADNGYCWTGMYDPKVSVWNDEYQMWLWESTPCINGPATVPICKYTVESDGIPGESPFNFGFERFPEGCEICQECAFGNRCGDELDTTWQNGTFTHEGLPEIVDNYTNADIPISGTVIGSHIDMHESDGVYESITEIESRGNPANRYSFLEHKWTVDVTGGSEVTFYLEAYHSPSSDGDDFVFAYSTDDSIYTDMITVTKTVDDNTYQTCHLLNDISGTVYIRVKDTDQIAGNRALDTIYIDHMFIRSVLAPPAYGVTTTIDEASLKVAPGSSTTYTIRVKNTGDLDASYCVGMSGTAVDEPTIDVSPLSWNTGTLTPNAEYVQTVTVSTTTSTPETTYTLTATAICDQDGSVTDSSTSDLIVSSETNVMHIASIDMTLETSGVNTNAVALVTVVDAAGASVGSATVEGHWSDATTDTDSGLTDVVNGEVALGSDRVKKASSGTTFTFTVDDVSLTGWTYNPAANVETSDSITV